MQLDSQKELLLVHLSIDSLAHQLENSDLVDLHVLNLGVYQDSDLGLSLVTSL